MSHGFDINLVKVTEAAAIASNRWVGLGDKNTADQAAVSAMRKALNQLPINGEVVIGEGEIDQAPMLYIGELVGGGGVKVDIAVDPIEGTRMTALGQANAISVIAIAEQGNFLKAPDMYMEKLIVGSAARGSIDIDLPLEDNLRNIAHVLNKRIEQLSVAIIYKPRHQALIHHLQSLGIKVTAFPDGDVMVSLQVCQPGNKIDVLYGIGGAPEGVISAAIAKALKGEMQAKLLPRYQVKGDARTLCEISKEEIRRCEEMGIRVNQKLQLSDLIRGENVLFSASGITCGDVLRGVDEQADTISVHSLTVANTNPQITFSTSTYSKPI